MTTPSLPAPATGRLGILTPGLGAVASTFIAGVIAARKGLAAPVGSLSQMGSFDDGRKISEVVPLADLDDIVFGGWDPISANALEAAETCGVLTPQDIAPLSGELEGVVAMDAVFEQRWVSRLEAHRVKESGSKFDQALALMSDMEQFQAEQGCDRLVVVWCGSTEAYSEAAECHQSLAAFEDGLKDNDPAIAPSQIYAYAALQLGVPFANGAPNLSLDAPWAVELAELRKVPVCGKDFKTGQTLMKTLVAPGLAARSLGIRGWFSTNILGNRDGMVLDAPENFKTKESSKLGVLDSILQPEKNPELYGNIDHVVRINYYPPKGDDKEGWDHIDVFGWMGYPMQIKVDFECKDSILAAPLVLDLALFLDLAQRADMHGVQDWLGFYFKAPQELDGEPVDHDLFHQRDRLLEVLAETAEG